jgi:hypothetical protein
LSGANPKGRKSKKLLKEGELDYPSPFAKIWRQHMKEKREDNPLARKKTLANGKNKKAKKRCPFGWIFYTQFNYMFKLGKKLTKKNMRPLPAGIKAGKVLRIAKLLI